MHESWAGPGSERGKVEGRSREGRGVPREGRGKVEERSREGIFAVFGGLVGVVVCSRVFSSFSSVSYNI